MLNVYLSGEIHTDWRDEIIGQCKQEGLAINFTSPVTNHELSEQKKITFGKIIRELILIL